MRHHFYILPIILLGCNANVSDKNNSEITDTISKDNHSQSATLDSISDNKFSTVQKNFKDNKGLKQGIWDFKQNGYLKGYETYTNDTLNGQFRHWINYPGQIIQGQYQKGLKTGIWKHYENDTVLVMVVKYQNDKSVWVGFPLADNEYHTPIKGFTVNSDSVLIECPYSNDTVWYKGAFIKKKPVGIHKMYFPNGKIKFEHDYKTSKVKVYDLTGKLIEEKKDDIGRSW